MSHFERSEAESRNLILNRLLNFGPLLDLPIEMTAAEIYRSINKISSNINAAIARPGERIHTTRKSCRNRDYYKNSNNTKS